MTLRHDPDPSEADWIVGTEDVDDAGTRALQGPPGLPAYATVWFDAEQDEHRRADPDLVADVTRLAAAHTRRPDRAWFALWEGWGGIDGGRTYAAMTQDRWFGRFFSAPRPQTVPPAFDARVLEAPRPSLLDLRSYLLFTGDLAAVGAWAPGPRHPDGRVTCRRPLSRGRRTARGASRPTSSPTGSAWAGARGSSTPCWPVPTCAASRQRTAAHPTPEPDRRGWSWTRHRAPRPRCEGEAMVRLILASQSPARLATLRAAGLDPEVVVSGVDESGVHTHDAANLAAALAQLKCRAVAGGIDDPDAVVIGCDSVLAIDGEIFGKPGDAATATARWRRMRGRSGVLHSGHCVRRGGREVVDTASTIVHFADVSDEEVAAYVATGEPLQVAGGFTIDGLGGAFVRGIEGDHHTVVGISLPMLRDLVADLGVRWTDLWSAPGPHGAPG